MKTKLVLMIVAMAILCVSALAQREMLTKEETVNYLNKKAQEADGGYRVAALKNNPKFYYSEISVKLKGDNVEVKYATRGEQSEDYLFHRTCVFNPAHIDQAEYAFGDPYGEKGSVVKTLSISMISKTAKCDQYETVKGAMFSKARPSIESNFDFPFLAGVPDNQSKIVKAFMHLRDLAKAEDDPFGN